MHAVLVTQVAGYVAWQVTGKCGSVLVRLIPAPRGTGIVSAPVPKKLLHMAGIDDCYTAACGQTATLGNFGWFPYLFLAYYCVLRICTLFCRQILWPGMCCVKKGRLITCGLKYFGGSCMEGNGVYL